MRFLFFIPLICILSFSSMFAQTPGCTDPLAQNYNAQATTNDGSCSYGVAGLTAYYSDTLDTLLVETSGLIAWNDRIWTHNDDTDTLLYALDTLTGVIQQTYPLPGIHNKDWEEISQDSFYLYIGDFGNNYQGNRTDLHILRIEKTSLLAGNPQIDTLFFSYSDQTVFTPAPPDSTDYDCEAMIVTADSIYLFTKQWTTYKTGLYALPKTPGTHTAQLRDSLFVQGLITGATYVPDKKLVVLCGYNGLLQPFLYLLYDFNGQQFLAANKRRLSVSLPFHQVEGICTRNGLQFTITNEKAVINNITIPQQIHHLDLGPYLQNYYNQLNGIPPVPAENTEIVVFPNPASDYLTVSNKTLLHHAFFIITDQHGRTVGSGELHEKNNLIPVRSLAPGFYQLNIRQNISGALLFSYTWVKTEQ